MALVVVLAFGGAVVAFTGGDAGSVDEVAEQAVEAAEDLDVDAGIDLLCSAPDDEDREGLDELISEAQDKAGTDEPDVDYDISEVDGDTEGSFLVTITSDESDLEGRDITLRVLVADDDGRSCIDGVEEPESGESYDL